MGEPAVDEAPAELGSEPAAGVEPPLLVGLVLLVLVVPLVPLPPLDELVAVEDVEVAELEDELMTQVAGVLCALPVGGALAVSLAEPGVEPVPVVVATEEITLEQVVFAAGLVALPPVLASVGAVVPRVADDGLTLDAAVGGAFTGPPAIASSWGLALGRGGSALAAILGALDTVASTSLAMAWMPEGELAGGAGAAG